MRELKFKVWDSVGNCWLQPNLIRDLVAIGVPDDPLDGVFNIHTYKNGRFKLSQYTGLKDIDGKDIYEGDIIVRRKDVDPKYHWVIEFHTDPDNSFAGFRGVGPLEFIWKTSACEIIGNIYENPELLNHQKSLDTVMTIA